MRRNPALQFGALAAAAIFSAGFMKTSSIRAVSQIQNIQATAPSTSQSTESAAQTPPESTTPPTPQEIKIANDRLTFDRALVDASVLLADLDNFRRGRSKKPVSLSAFRSLEIRLNAIVDADPSNTQAREMAKSMQMAQFQLLQPSVAVAQAADRQLYASAMSEKMHDDGVDVSANGGEARVLRFTSPHMTREMGKQLMDLTKVAEQARQLEFKMVVFTNGRRSWRFEPDRNRYR